MAYSLQFGRYYFFYQFSKAARVAPDELFTGLARISEQLLHFGRPEIMWIDPDADRAGLRIDTDLIETLAPPLYRDTSMATAALAELTSRMHITAKLRGRSLVKAAGPLHPQNTDRVQAPQRTGGVAIGGIFGGVETHLHMRLGAKIVKLGRPHLLHQSDQIGRIGQIAEVKVKPAALHMQIQIETINPLRVEGGGAAFNAVNRILLTKQKTGEIGAVLAGDAGDEDCGRGHGVLG
jgi:hypothetical protein